MLAASDPLPVTSKNPNDHFRSGRITGARRAWFLDLDSDDGRAQLRRLAEGADFLIESAEPGVLASKGLGFDDLATTNPALIYLSISAFGSDGPRASWAESDLTVLASSGQLVIAGDADRPPVRPSLPQAYYHVASEAAGAALIALYERQTWSGLGQFIDLSAQQSVNQAAQSTGLAHPLNATPTKRFGSGVKAAGLNIQLLWACADGHVSVTFLFGGAVVEFTQNLMNWVCEEGFCDEATRDQELARIRRHARRRPRAGGGVRARQGRAQRVLRDEDEERAPRAELREATPDRAGYDHPRRAREHAAGGPRVLG